MTIVSRVQQSPTDGLKSLFRVCLAFADDYVSFFTLFSTVLLISRWHVVYLYKSISRGAFNYQIFAQTVYAKT